MVEPLPAPKPVTEPPAVEPQAPSRPANDEPAPRPLPAATSGISVPLAQSTTPIEPPPAIPEPRRDIPVEARNVTPAPLPELGGMAPKTERPNADPLPARASDDAAVRGILGRYAEAYSRLDAS